MKLICNPVYNELDQRTQTEAEVSALLDTYFAVIQDDFTDTDGRVYRYGSPDGEGLFYGWELDPESREPISEGQLLFSLRPDRHGFERLMLPGVSKTEAAYLADRSVKEEKKKKRGFFSRLLDKKEQNSGLPEGFVRLFCFKKDKIYYLIYSAPAAFSTGFASGVYVSKAPLGPFHYQLNNPFSQAPGGFLKGVGNGALVSDEEGRLYFIARCYSEMQKNLSGAIGIYPAQIDPDGTLFVVHSFQDHPLLVPARGELRASDETVYDRKPYQALLSYGKALHASSVSSGHEPAFANDEDPETYFRPKHGERAWLQADLLEAADLSGIQLVFRPENEGKKKESFSFQIQASVDGEDWFMLSDCLEKKMPSVSFIPLKDVSARYVILILPCTEKGKVPGVTALRIFGKKAGHRPEAASLVSARMTDEMSAVVGWRHDSRVTGHLVSYGISPTKLYLSRTVYGMDKITITELNKDQHYYLRVDSFNECGITEGSVLKLK